MTTLSAWSFEVPMRFPAFELSRVLCVMITPPAPVWLQSRAVLESALVIDSALTSHGLLGNQTAFDRSANLTYADFVTGMAHWDVSC